MIYDGIEQYWMVLDGIGWNWLVLDGIQLFQITIEHSNLKWMGWDGSPGGRRYRAPYGAEKLSTIFPQKAEVS